MTSGKTKALTRQTFVGKVMSLLFNMLSRLVMAFLPRSKRLLIFLYFFALIAEEGFLISSYYSLELCIQMFISFLFSFAFCFSSFHSYLLVPSLHGKQMGKQWKQCQTLYFGAPKSLQMVIAPMKLKDTYSLEGKLRPTQAAYSKAETLLCQQRSVQSRLWFFYSPVWM